MLQLFLLMTLFLAVIYYDIRYYLIPNRLTFTFIVIGWAVSLYSYGISGLFESLTGTLVGFIILFIPFLFGAVGGGDVKFLAALGSLASLSFLLKAVVGGFIIAAIVSIFILIKNRKVTSIKHILFFILYRQKLTELSHSKAYIPLGAHMSIAGILLIFSTWVGM